MVPVAVALAIRLVRRTGSGNSRDSRSLHLLYWMAIAATFLVHGLGPFWCALFILPFVLLEWAARGRDVPVRMPLVLLLPIAVSAVVLTLGREAAEGVLITPLAEPVRPSGWLSSFYLPGNALKPVTETHTPIVWVGRETWRILHPLFVTRYPMAIAGFILTWVLLIYRRGSDTARFLLGVTFLVLLLTFTPPGAGLTAMFINWRMVFRLTWVLPWGLIVAFLVLRLKLKPVVTGLVMVAIGLVLSRGDIRNYGRKHYEGRMRNRPSAQAEEAFAFLASEPHPQGVTFASEATGRMIAGFLPDAYPVNFREYGPVHRDSLARIVGKNHITRGFLDVVSRNKVNYILLEHDLPLAGALGRSRAGFVQVHSNDGYAVWRAESANR
jgi:hypothetical protein